MPNKLKLYNTLSRKIETFVPADANEVKIYTCGPTVYSQPHIGNFAAYIYWDLLVRTLRADGYGVKRALNLTDVGHLTSDADDGEDKLEKGARLSGKTVWEVADYYIERYLNDYRLLHLTPPEVIARATDYIPEEIAIVDILTEKGYTYETKDGIYYDTSKFPRYADFARLDLEHLRAGARIEFSDEKRNPSDFAVWKFIQPNEKHDMRWDYLDRPGYPGWHLECSAIIHAELGETIDIHAGGVDHIPVHHTNEIAQSEAAFEKQLAKYWLHCHHLTSDGEKISKSLGNGYTLEDLARHGYLALDFKTWVLQGHYQSERDFNSDGLESARVRRLNWRNRIAHCYQRAEEDSALDSAAIDPVLAALNDNLNSPLAFAAVDAAGNQNLAFWREVDQLFGLGLLEDSPRLTKDQQNLLDQRARARLQKDYASSDQIRDALAAQNIGVLDSPDGQIWQYLR